MIFDFPTILTLVLFASALFITIEKWLYNPSRWSSRLIRDFFDFNRSILPVVVVVWLVRSFFMQPFVVVSGSLEPSLQPYELILVDQIVYGLRLPVIHRKILEVSHPKKGDIVLFRWPANPHFTYIKRVVAVAGDHIQYHHKMLTVNGVSAGQTFIKNSHTIDPDNRAVVWHEEQLGNYAHPIYLDPEVQDERDIDIVVPKGNYFMMGDNRDFSGDSRMWGFVPEENIIGRARYILLSIRMHHWQLRLSRIGKVV